MPTRRTVVSLLLAFTIILGVPPAAAAAPTLKGRAVWAHPRDAGTTEASVRAFVAQLASAHVNTVVMEVKTATGLYWPSQRFAEAVVANYRDFDFPAVLIREAHARGIQVHAWFFDYAEGANSHVAKTHPEWLALSPDGKPTTAEILRGRSYGLAWMCPARRPGYTDQWLIPLITEFAERYDVDAIHHDYVRYPGDVAPDTYCFCDFCLKALPAYASYLSQARPDDRLVVALRPPAPRGALGAQPQGPAADSRWSRARDEEPLPASGEATVAGGRLDLDYFFYEYGHTTSPSSRARCSRRCAQGEAPHRGVGRRVQEPRPERTVPWAGLAAVLALGPVPSIPMDYPRALRRGSFETHLDLLAEAIQQQKTWARDFPHLWIGVAATGLSTRNDGPARAALAPSRPPGSPAPTHGPRSTVWPRA